jgi:hypothetical protein
MKAIIRTCGFAGAALCIGVVAQAAPPLPGAIFTTDKNGTIVNGNTKYLSKCGDTGVYLDGGPGPNAPRTAASLPDGDYYFQVTDPSGKTLLSTDPVKERCITVSNGIIVGNCPTGTHENYADQDQGGNGAKTVELCAAPDVPFLDTPNNGGVYKVWATPVGDGTLTGGGFVGDVNQADNDCGGGKGIPGCFHGFIASRSKTDNFKIKDTTTYCITVHKEVVDKKEGSAPGVSWEINVADSLGVTNTFFTDGTGSTDDQICGLTAGSYVVSEVIPEGYTQLAVEVNGVPIGSSAAAISLGSGKVKGSQTVLFINEYTGTGGSK